jgi:hypothetical protein
MDRITCGWVNGVSRQAALLVTVAAATFGLAQPVAAQSASAPMAVSVIVVRSCSVETAAATPLSGGQIDSARLPVQPDVKVRCGNSAVTYSSQLGVTQTPFSTKQVRPTVVNAPDGRGVTIQF